MATWNELKGTKVEKQANPWDSFDRVDALAYNCYASDAASVTKGISAHAYADGNVTTSACTMDWMPATASISSTIDTKISKSDFDDAMYKIEARLHDLEKVIKVPVVARNIDHWRFKRNEYKTLQR